MPSTPAKMKKWYFISPLILQKLIWIPTRLVLRLFGRFEVNGLENLKEVNGNAIFGLNHTSELDPILLPAALQFGSHFSPIFYTSREHKFYVRAGWRKHFYGGTFFKAWGAYPVFVGLRDYEKSLSFHIDIVRNGGSMCVFPEGRVTRDGNIQEAKGGIAYLAYATGTPIIPVRLDGTFWMTFTDFILRRRRISISFGKPIRVAELLGTNPSAEDFKRCANEVVDKIRGMGAVERPVTVKDGLLAPVGA